MAEQGSQIEQFQTELDSRDSARQLAVLEKLLHLPDVARGLVAELLNLLNTESDEVVEYAVGALENMEPPPADAALKISNFLKQNELRGFWAATLLGRLGGSAASAVPQLEQSLAQSPSIAVRERAAWALGQIGPAAKSSLPALQVAAASDAPRLSRFAKEAISSISGMR
jgi:HEAT repeat protein